MKNLIIHHVKETDTETYQQKGTGLWVKKIKIKTEEGIVDITLWADDENNLKD